MEAVSEAVRKEAASGKSHSVIGVSASVTGDLSSYQMPTMCWEWEERDITAPNSVN